MTAGFLPRIYDESRPVNSVTQGEAVAMLGLSSSPPLHRLVAAGEIEKPVRSTRGFSRSHARLYYSRASLLAYLERKDDA